MLPNIIKNSNIVVEGRPERRREGGTVVDLSTGGVTVTAPSVSAQLGLDVLYTLGDLSQAEVTGRLPVFVIVPLQVQGVVTVAVLQYGVKQTESLTLLKYINEKG